MFDNKLVDRQKKFAKEITVSSNNNSASLIRKREEMNMELRKNKLFDRILERRLNSLNTNFIEIKTNSFQSYEIDIKTLNVPEILKSNYNKHCDKLNVISKLLNDEDEGDDNSGQNIDFKKFAIICLRKFICEKKEKLSPTEITFIYNNLYKHVLYYFLEYKCEGEINNKIQNNNDNNFKLEELKIKYETSWILINLTSENEQFCEDLLHVKNLQRLDQILQNLITLSRTSNTNDVIRHIFWIFSNLLGGDSQSNLIIRNTIKLQDRIECFLSNEDYVQNLHKSDIKNVITAILWTVSNFMRYVYKDTRYTYKALLVKVLHIMKIASVKAETDTEIQPNLNAISKAIYTSIVRECIETMIYFTNCQALVQVFIENDAVPLLLNAFTLLSTADKLASLEQVYEDIFNIVKLLSEFLTVEDSLMHSILKYPIIQKFLEILETCNSNYTTMMIEDKLNYEQDSRILKEVCLAISNITASTQENIERIILDEKIVENLLQINEKFGNGVKYEIYHIFYNAFYGGNSYIRSEIIRKNIHRLYIDKLNNIYDCGDKLSTTSKKVIEIILEALLLFLEFGEKKSTKINFIKIEMENDNIVAVLEKLQFSQNSEIEELTHKLLVRYWTDDECYYEDPSDLINLR